MKKLIFMLVTVTMFSSNVLANPITTSDTYKYEDYEKSPRYIAMTSLNNNLNISSKGKATCYGYTKTNINYNARVKVELQKYNSGWSTIKSWDDTDSVYVSISKDYYISKGYSYRVKTTHYALNSSGSVIESVVLYSSTLSY